MKSIRTRIMRSFLAISIISLTVASLFTGVTTFNLRKMINQSNEEIGSMSADNTETALVAQALKDMTDLAEAKAQLIDGELEKVIGSIALIANCVEHMYTYPDEYKLIPYNHANDCPENELTMQWVLSPGMVLEDVLEETYLHGNMKSVYDAIMKSNPSVSSIYLTTVSGINSGYDSYAHTKPEVYEGRNTDWYVKARDTGGIVISETYQDSFGRGLTVSMSMPCYGKDGAFVGVVGLDMQIEKLNDMIVETTIGSNGYALLLKGSEKIVSAPGLDQVSDEYMEYFLGSAHEEIRSDIGKEVKGVKQSQLYRDGKDNGIYVIWAPVTIAGWNFVYILPVDDIIAPVIETRLYIEELAKITTQDADKHIITTNVILIILFIVIICVVIWLTTRISSHITKPVTALTQDVACIGNGNLEFVSKIRTGDEIEELSRCFEQMTIELKKYIVNLSKVTADRERIATELDIATQIQSDMLPSIFPPFPDRPEFDIHASMLPAREIGGDFYDFFLIDDDHLCVVIADVSGKSVPAALFMVIAKTLINNRARTGESPQEVFINVNRQLCEGNETAMFVTAWMGVLEISSGKMTFVNAGHNPPLLKKSDGSFQYLKTKRGFVLAGMNGYQYKQQELQLDKGDMLYLYTDGVTEANNAANELYGEERLQKTLDSLAEQKPGEILPRIKADIDLFADGAPQFDDITMLAILIH